MAAPPSDPYYPYRLYADAPPGGEGWTYSDHSRFMRMHIRGLFRQGEQLWDSDYNNNGEMFSLWRSMYAIYRRNQKDGQVPPYWSPNLVIRVYDPKHANIDEPHEDMIYFFGKGMKYNLWYEPHVNHWCWVDADRMLITYTKNGWTAVSRLADKQWNVEVAIFIQGAKKGKMIATKVISQPFRVIKAQTNGSRAMGIEITYPFQILKNGVVVGNIVQQRYVCTIDMLADTDFLEGDLLQVRANALQTASTATVSIVGTML
jgi:hypothetical protein